MRAVAFAALLAGCGFVHHHPLVSTAITNSALVVGSGVCALDCSGGWRTAADGVLIGELALSSLAAVAAVELIAIYAGQSH